MGAGNTRQKCLLRNKLLLFLIKVNEYNFMSHSVEQFFAFILTIVKLNLVLLNVGIELLQI